MSSTVTDPPLVDATPGSTTPEVPTRRYVLYSGLLILLPVLFLLSSIPIVRSASFPRISADPFLLHPDYAFSLSHANCGIVVFGDSTAVTGVDPTVVEHNTGLKTCNIAQTQSVLAILGTKALDDYLQHNQAPKFLVIQLAPESFSRKRDDFFWPEGLMVLLRRDFGLHAIALLATHPAEAYGFAIWAIKTRVNGFRAVPDFSSTNAIFYERRGLITLPKPPERTCTKNWQFYPPDLAWIQSLREKYTKPGTTVIVNVSPVPTCSGDLDRISSSLDGVTDNRLPLYPIDLFCDLDRHLTLGGADRFSRELAQQILYNPEF